MKRAILVVLFVAASAGTAAAQKFHLGAEAGVNVSDLRGDTGDMSKDNLTSFVGGGFLSLGLGDNLAIRPEVIYSRKGLKNNAAGSSYHLDYMEIPVLLEILPVKQLGILVGPSFDANVEKTGFNNVRKGDVGVIGGLQVHFNRLFVNGRYELGLVDVQKQTNLKNGTLSIMVGFEII